MVQKLEAKLSNMGYQTQLFPSDEEINEHIRSKEYGNQLNKVCFGVVI